VLRSFFLVSVIFQCLNFSVSAAGRHLDTEMESSLITSQPQSQSRLPTYDETPGTTRPVNTSEQPDAAFCLLCCGKTFVRPNSELTTLAENIAQYEKTLNSWSDELKNLENDSPSDPSIPALKSNIKGILKEIDDRTKDSQQQIGDLNTRQERVNFTTRWIWNPLTAVGAISALSPLLQFTPWVSSTLVPTIAGGICGVGSGVTLMIGCCKKYRDENKNASETQGFLFRKKD